MRLIDAEKVKEILKHLLYETAMNNSGGASLMCEDIAENRLETWLGLVPTVDAEPVRHGHWDNKIIDARFDVPHTVARCSNCKGKIWVYEENYVVKYPYCPLCGCKMDEVTE